MNLENDLKEWREVINRTNPYDLRVGQMAEPYNNSYYTTCDRSNHDFFPARVIDITWHDNDDHGRHVSGNHQYAVATLYNEKLNITEHIGVPWLREAKIMVKFPKGKGRIYNLAYHGKSSRIRKKNLKRLQETQLAA